jgi:hypothetical protein
MGRRLRWVRLYLRVFVSIRGWFFASFVPFCGYSLPSALLTLDLGHHFLRDYCTPNFFRGHRLAIPTASERQAWISLCHEKETPAMGRSAGRNGRCRASSARHWNAVTDFQFVRRSESGCERCLYGARRNHVGSRNDVRRFVTCPNAKSSAGSRVSTCASPSLTA